MNNLFKLSKKNFHKKVEFIRTLWGYNFNESNCKKLMKIDQSNGFKGYEIAYSFIDKSFLKQLNADLISENMNIILQVHARDQNSFYSQIDEIFSSLNLNNIPIINCHLGYDYSDLETKSKLLIDVNNHFKSKINNNKVELSIETHRGTIFNNPNEMIDIYNKLNCSSNITLDLSHFVVSYERLLNNDNYPKFKRMMEIFQYTKLIHMRVSTENIIQVNDPLSDYYKNYNEYYCNIWQEVISKSNKNNNLIYATLEYGPEPYSNSPQQAKNHIENNFKLLSFLNKRFNI